jgi:Tfp pilus assembly protein PilF/pimeloyl-ACP methyl ester carboxylesterase
MNSLRWILVCVFAASLRTTVAAAQPNYTPWSEWLGGRSFGELRTRSVDPMPSDSTGVLPASRDRLHGVYKIKRGAAPTVTQIDISVTEWDTEAQAARYAELARAQDGKDWDTVESVPLPFDTVGKLYLNSDAFYKADTPIRVLGLPAEVTVKGWVVGKRLAIFFTLTVDDEPAHAVPMPRFVRTDNIQPVVDNRIKAWARLRPAAKAEAVKFMRELVELDPEEIRPTIFIHGIGGSVLARRGTVNHTELWPFAPWDDRAHLMLEPNGKRPEGSLVFAPEPLGTVAGGTPWAADVYAPLLAFFERTNREVGKQLWYFPYDWRLDNAEHLPLLDQLVDEVLKKTGKRKVNLVTHSMGGLVAKGYVHGRGRNKVDKLISIALPYRGGAFVFRGIADGYDFENTTVRQELMKILLQNWPSGFQIYPRYKFIWDPKAKRYLSLNESHAIRYYGYQSVGLGWLGLGADVYNLTGTHDWVNAPALVARANRYHQRFNDGDQELPVPPPVKHFAIVGWGVPTEVFYKLRDVAQPVPGQGYLLTQRDGGQRVVEVVPVLRDGDGKVPLRQSSDFGAGAKFYYIKHQERHGKSSAEHTELTWNSDVHYILDQLLSNKPIERSARDQKPAMASSRIAVAHQIFLENHSAVTMRITDPAKKTRLTLASNQSGRPIDRGDLISLGGVEHAWMPADGGPYEVEIAGVRAGKFTILGGLLDGDRKMAFTFPALDATPTTTGKFTVSRAELAAGRLPTLTVTTDGRTTSVPARAIPVPEVNLAGDDIPDSPDINVDEELAALPPLPDESSVAGPPPSPSTSSPAAVPSTGTVSTATPPPPARIAVDTRTPNIADARFIDMTRDVVGPNGSGAPDGHPDGRFRLTLGLPTQTEIKSINMSGSNAQGRWSDNHYWTTQPGVYWIIGIERAGTRLNPTQAQTLGRFSGVVELDLFAADLRWFHPGNWVLIEVVLGNGTKLSRNIPIGATPAATTASVAVTENTTLSTPPAHVAVDTRTANIADVRFIDVSRDVVGPNGSGVADGHPDGRFKLTLGLPGQTEIKSINLSGTNAQGQWSNHYWTTQPGVYWIVGVERSGARINSGQAQTLGRFSGVVELDLFVADPPWFRPGNYVWVEVVLGNGTKLSRNISVGTPATATTSIAATENATTRTPVASPAVGTPPSAQSPSMDSVPSSRTDAGVDWTAKARAHNLKGELAEAASAAERVLQSAPATPNLNSWLAEVYIAMGNWNAARAAIDRELALQPRSGWVVSWLGSLEYESGRAQQAAATFARAAQLDPNAAGHRYRNGQTMLQHQQPRRALTEFVAALHMQPGYAGAYYFLGDCYARLSMPQAAVENYRRYLQLDPTSEWAPRARAEIARLSRTN